MNKGRLTEIDVFRGLAALSVILFHYTTRYNQLFGHAKEHYLLNFKYGYLGVQMFFIISGFVIFMTLNKCLSTKEFAFKRITRLYPAYIVAVIITFTLVTLYHLNGRQVSIKDAIINLTMLQGFIPGISDVDGVYWSLNIEITFYVIMAILFSIKLFNKITIISLIWLISSFLVNFLNAVSPHRIFGLMHHYGIMDYCHLFIAGVMFYKLTKNNKLIYHVVIVICAIYGVIFKGMAEGMMTIVFFILFYGIVFKKLQFLSSKPLVFLGTISYALYLVHQNIGYIILNMLEKHGYVNEAFVLIPIVVSILLATGITFCIERPIQAFLKKSFLKNKTVAIPSEKTA